MKNRICAANMIADYDLLPEGYEEAVIREQRINIATKLIEDLQPGEEVIFEGPQSWTQSAWGNQSSMLRSESRIESLTRCGNCKKWSGDQYVERGVCKKISMAPTTVLPSSPSACTDLMVTSRHDFCSWAEPIK